MQMLSDRLLHIWSVEAVERIRDPTLQSFKQVEVQDATLLGAPLFPGSVLDSTYMVWSRILAVSAG